MKGCKKEEEEYYSLGKQKERLADKLSQKKLEKGFCNIKMEKEITRNNESGILSLLYEARFQ